MTATIEAVLFDMGGTLRSSVAKDEASKVEAVRGIVELLEMDASAEEFAALLSPRFKNYYHWARQNLIELNERDLWTKWILPDWPVEKISPLAVQLNQIWRDATGERIIFPETREVVLELFRRGYRLGLVSNTISSVEVPQALEQMKVTGCFETVILSCLVGMRKPDPAILLDATRRMGVKPENCAYIGDRLNRDIESSRKAGFGTVVIRRNEDFQEHQKKYPGMFADHYIDNLTELLDLFPAQQKRESASLYQASLSTMWAKNNFPSLSDFFDTAGRLGFSHIELNHQIDSSMLAGIDLSNYRFSSIHEPCPADVSTDELKSRDWLISSPDEDKRVRGVESIKRSIDLAHQLDADVIVVHSGMVSPDLSAEKVLRKLFDAGKAETDEYREQKQKLIKQRGYLIGPCFEAVKRSLLELLEYAAPFHIRLALENRYHYFDIPSLDEMRELLALAGPEQLGFVYDVGHAQALDRLGFYPYEEWLRRYGSRMIEIHLHDVIGVNDHHAPGLGEIEFDRIKPYLPESAIRTFELHHSNSPEQVKSGLKYLAEHNFVKPL